jgi:DNA polymerase-3 subunit delta
VKANFSEIARAVDAPSAAIRIILLHGPDEQGSNTLVQRLAKAMGADASRTDYSGDQLAKDPAALADAAASISLFGERSWVRVSPAGEEVLPAVEAVLQAPAVGNPVVIIAGTLRKTSKLLTRCIADNSVLSYASYPPGERDAIQIVVRMASERGLRMDSSIARRIVDNAGADRALLAGEVEKLALYHDAAPDRPAEATHDALDALSSDHGDDDVPAMAALTLSGDVAGLARHMNHYRQTGGSLTGVLRLAMMKASGIADACAGRRSGRPMFQREAEEMSAMQRRWTNDTISRSIVRMAAAERASRLGGGIGETLIAQELLAIARQAAKGR